MSSDNSISEKTKAKIDLPTLISIIVVCVVFGSTVTAYQANILRQLEKLNDSSLKVIQAQMWIDTLRENNPTLKVPPLPMSPMNSKSDNKRPEALAVVVNRKE